MAEIGLVKRGLESAGATVLVYHRSSRETCSEVDVEEWLRKRRSGKEKRVLIAEADKRRSPEKPSTRKQYKAYDAMKKAKKTKAPAPRNQ